MTRDRHRKGACKKSTRTQFRMRRITTATGATKSIFWIDIAKRWMTNYSVGTVARVFLCLFSCYFLQIIQENLGLKYRASTLLKLGPLVSLFCL